MTNAVLGFQNHAAVGVLTASAAAAGLGAGQLATPHGATSASWQTPSGTTSAWVRLDAGAAVEWGAAALCNTNLTPSATVRWRLSDDPNFSVSPVWDTGAVQAVAAGYRQAVAVEPASLQAAVTPNAIRNPRFAGGTAGTPGTFPTNMSIETDNGLTRTIVGFGVEFGLPYMDVRWAGTTTGGFIGWRPEGTTVIAASPGQVWTNSFMARLVAGSGAGLALRVVAFARTSAGALVATYTASGGAPAATVERLAVTTPALPATTAFVSHRIDLVTSVGAAIDATIRFYAPQAELGASATAPLLPRAVARYLRVDIEDSSNPAGVLRAAQLYAGPVVRPQRNIGFESAFAREAEVPAVVTRGGQQFPTFRYARRSWRVALSSLDANDVWSLTQALQIAAQDGTNVLFIPFPSGPDIAREAVFGIVSGASGVGWPSKSPALRSWAATITERL